MRPCTSSCLSRSPTLPVRTGAWGAGQIVGNVIAVGVIGALGYGAYAITDDKMIGVGAGVLGLIALAPGIRAFNQESFKDEPRK